MLRKTRIGLLQLEPSFKQPELSIQQADNLISSIEPNEIDLLMLPEMAFTGYSFTSFEDVVPFAESEDGISITWAKKTAQKLNCHVMLGFPQRIQRAGVRQVYNALGIVSNQGELIKVYHKTQLYPPVDDLWAKPGEGFLVIDLNIARLNGESGKPVKCCIGICMDLSPDRFEAPFDAYELSSFAVTHHAEIMLCAMAWLSVSPVPDPFYTEHGKSLGETLDTMNYWATRCIPFWKLGNRAFVTCNRVGKEGETIFTGTSCAISNSHIFKNSPEDHSPAIISHASKHKPELLIVDVPLP
ncbi:Carbon-nitrogen hydrolase [Puccinia graminis f. sp. tritici]|uniref:Carbon-nitrogen hydrolase n=1 Tax=Puccinia graminis f. sp. tritici TaxID=56615 RepID=A0A5B0Q526_PUCGR|nr:Carbon-nitrogen hydrolase [Puccinia graminis f. sp. tritici]KAA1138739.1 Carbon-nitrogen hydrolase [Puccinia graminis f. sp. tritici]